MSEADRQHKLRRQNRLEELRVKHGRELEDQLLPPWLDSIEGFYATVRAGGDFGVLGNSLVYGPRKPATPPGDVEPSWEPPQRRRMLRPAEALKKLDRYGETPLFECPVCGDDLAKANTRINLWRCTNCGTNGRASDLASPDNGWVTPVNLA